MDKTTHADLLLSKALEALRRHGLKARIVPHAPRVDRTRPDAVVKIGRGTAGKLYAAEVKRNVHVATIGAFRLRHAGTKQPPLLVADYVTPAIAEQLRANDIPFVDTVGNAYLKQPGLLIWVKGNRREAPGGAIDLRKQQAVRAFEPAGLRVLFAFLCHPPLVDRPFREIADKADVAHGTVGEVMAELPHRGYVYDFGKTGGGRKLRNVEDLLVKWAEAYARKLKPKLFIGRYAARMPDWWRDVDPTKYGMTFGAEPAAARITRHLKPAIITLYGDRAEPRLLLDHALRTDPGGDVEIDRRFWRFETDEERRGLAPLPLIYADLLATGDPRCIETAGLIRERYLAGFERET